MSASQKAKEKVSGNVNKKVSVPETMESLKTPEIKALFDLYKPYMSMVIPKHITPERIIQIATTVITRNPDIAKCTTSSLIGAVLQSAILGLDPTPQLGQCYFVPYWNSKIKKYEVQFMIGYQGYLELARRSGQIESVSAYVVYEKDEFEVELGLEPKLKHKPNFTVVDRGQPVAAYAIWKYKDGGYYFEVMTKEEILKAKAVSKAAESPYSPWNTFEEEMWRKTVIRRSRKYVPVNVEIQKAILTDEAVINVEDFNLQEKGVDLAKIEAAVIEEKITTPEPKQEKPEEVESEEYNNDDDSKKEELIEKIKSAILEMANEDIKTASSLLYDFTSFKKDGKYIEGVRYTSEMNKFSLKRLQTVWGKVKAEYEEFLKSNNNK